LGGPYMPILALFLPKIHFIQTAKFIFRLLMTLMPNPLPE